jgi:hypothetical protein
MSAAACGQPCGGGWQWGRGLWCSVLGPGVPAAAGGQELQAVEAVPTLSAAAAADVVEQAAAS